MISIEKADQLIRSRLSDFGTEEIPFLKSAGRVLKQTISAERDQPPFDRVTMDGIACQFDLASTRYQIQGSAFAGQPQKTLDTKNHCLEVMTGAVLPNGCDTVIPVEEISVEHGWATLKHVNDIKAGQFIHRSGSDHAAATPLLEASTIIGMPEIAIIASAGKATIKVAKSPRVTIIATGDELVAAGDPLLPHQIRLSNSPAIAIGLYQHGVSDVCLLHLPDAKGQLQLEFAKALKSSDVLILSGGVSMGKADFVPAALAAAGVEQVFHKVTQRPGKPLWFGTGPAQQLVFALPGNPLSAMLGFRRHVMPALMLAMGAAQDQPQQIALAADFSFKPALTALIPVRHTAENAAVMPVNTNTSGDFAALAGTDGFIELPAERDSWNKTERVAYYPWRMLSS